ncbi:serine-threonine kinase [Acanthamoeba polyphaga moumouvirus]|uniref:Serine/Threonine protein kinase n=2 Tax=Moumouvirus TaxID=3080801 RepID=L7RCR6_9VIRU|nr:serine-threonine kinase [Acanthamoeba polyphaga moumouvirus]AEX62632.1 mitogen-activated protein kinase 2 [Moumouvirus Monve]AGC02072.1 Serine/Threonine protein kinase [Acanthamoeba polyphaga moumouvirus]AQN68440.1 serine/threonine protein kinase [Saudi moumouvirus]
MINLSQLENIKILSKKQNSTVLSAKLFNKNIIGKYYDICSRSMFIELNILASCKHSNIVSLEDILSINNGPILMILEKLDFSLEEIISHSNLSLLDKYNILLQIAYGIKYLHINNIIHFDIKPDNIMLKNNTYKIIDFGASEYIFEENICTNHTKCTSTHRPPEAFYKNKLNSSCDIWSFGIIICELLTNCPIYQYKYFPSYTNNKTYDNNVYQFIVSNKFNNLVNVLPKKLQSCLDINPKNRPNIEFVIKKLHKLSNNYIHKNIFDNNLSLNYSKNYLPVERIIIDKMIQNHDQNNIASLYIKLDLIHRTDFNENIINVCEMVFNNKNINVDKEYIKKIILQENGILFQYHHHVYNLDNFMTLIDDYTTKSIHLINNINLINFHQN